jgi:hypothetical protein
MWSSSLRNHLETIGKGDNLATEKKAMAATYLTGGNCQSLLLGWLTSLYWDANYIPLNLALSKQFILMDVADGLRGKRSGH